jgi:hypothetical protein
VLKGNKGEWGELYAFCYLLRSGKLHAADKDLNPLEHIYFPIQRIIREETPGQVYSYEPGEDKIKIYLNSECIKEVNKADFDNAIKIMNSEISKGKRAFEIDELNDFFAGIFSNKLKADSEHKQDIVIQIYDINTGITPICGFSIKSYLGANPTLINPGENTNFIYRITNCTDSIMNEVNQINTKNKIIDKMDKLIECGCEFDPNERLISARFQENLEFIDSMMPKFLSLAVLYSYQYKLKSSNQIITKMKECNPLNFSNVKMYEYKFKKFLCACALGMTPEKDWEGEEDASGGYIVVKSDGTVVCYHIYNRADFERYLFDYTYFDRASTSRYNYMSVYKENNSFYIKLNLQVRFK